VPKQSLSFFDRSMDQSNLEDTGKSLVLWQLCSTALLLIVRSVGVFGLWSKGIFERFNSWVTSILLAGTRMSKSVGPASNHVWRNVDAHVAFLRHTRPKVSEDEASPQMCPFVLLGQLPCQCLQMETGYLVTEISHFRFQLTSALFDGETL
jgi:hypothetical protein